MIRYQGESLPDRPRIAVIANDALGNFVVATPLLQMLRTRHAEAQISFYGGTRTRELQEASDLIGISRNLHGATSEELSEWLNEQPKPHLIFNCDSAAYAKTLAGLLSGPETYVAGPCVGPGGRGELPFPLDPRGDLWRDSEWIAEDLASRYPFLQSGFIAEIFCRLAYLEGPVPPYRLASQDPGRAIPDVLIATAASLPEKLWPLESWRAALNALRAQNLTVGLLGAKPAAQKGHWLGADAEQTLVEEGLVEDLRGACRLPEVVGALAKAKKVLTLDNGILHLAAATSTPTVGLFRHGIHRLWAPPFGSVRVLTPGPSGSVPEIAVETVLEALACPTNAS